VTEIDRIPVMVPVKPTEPSNRHLREVGAFLSLTGRQVLQSQAEKYSVTKTSV